MDRRFSADRPLWPLAAAAGLIPLFGAMVWVPVAMQSGTVASCVPFLEGCTSISSTGRHAPASYIYRGIMLPYAALLGFYWYLNGTWVRTLHGCPRGAWIARLGIAGSVCLVVYSVLLGSEGRAYELMRRYGIYLYFFFTIVAQLLLVLAYRRVLPALRGIAGVQLACCISMFVAGAADIVLKPFVDDPDRMENLVEWNFSLVMMVNLALVAVCWRHTDFRWRLSATARTDR